MEIRHTPEQSELGKRSAYADAYDPGLLFPCHASPSGSRSGSRGACPSSGPICGPATS